MASVESNLTEDGWRDAYALAVAFLRDDYEGQDAILGHADPVQLACAAVALATGALVFTGQTLGHMSPDEALAFAEAGLAGALRAVVGDDDGEPGQ